MSSSEFPTSSGNDLPQTKRSESQPTNEIRQQNRFLGLPVNSPEVRYIINFDGINLLTRPRGSETTVEFATRYAQTYIRIQLGARANPEDVEDLSSEVAARLLPLPFDKYGTSSNVNAKQFISLIKTIAHNLVVDLIRHRVQHDTPSLEQMVESGTDFKDEEAEAAFELIDRPIARILDFIPNRDYREVMRLRYVEGLRYKEIANRLHISTETVNSRIRRGITMLKWSQEDIRRMLDEEM